MEKEVVENQAAPVVEQPATEGQASKADVQNASVQAQKEAPKTTATESEPTAQPEFDVRKSYEELRKEFTRRTQEESQLKKQYAASMQQLKALQDSHKSLAQMIEKATEKPVNPEQFLRDLQTQGPAALDAYLEKKLGGRVKEVEEKYNKQYEDAYNRSLVLEAELEKFKRISDSTTYPDFKTLLPTMQAIADSENCPVDFKNLPISEIYDTLYKLAKSQHSEEAIKQAEQLGQKRAEAALAKESVTTVAGGGKAGTTSNPAEINDLGKLRQYFVSQLGEAE